jgi:hypothetical protein
MSNRQKAISWQERGRENVELLQNWARDTPLRHVPLNQFGTVARSRVCKLNKIPTSTVRTNPHIKEFFEKLDALIATNLAVSRTTDASTSLRSNEAKELRAENVLLARRLQDSELHLQRLRYLEDFAIFVS